MCHHLSLAPLFMASHSSEWGFMKGDDNGNLKHQRTLAVMNCSLWCVTLTAVCQLELSNPEHNLSDFVTTWQFKNVQISSGTISIFLLVLSHWELSCSKKPLCTFQVLTIHDSKWCAVIQTLPSHL